MSQVATGATGPMQAAQARTGVAAQGVEGDERRRLKRRREQLAREMRAVAGGTNIMQDAAARERLGALERERDDLDAALARRVDVRSPEQIASSRAALAAQVRGARETYTAGMADRAKELRSGSGTAAMLAAGEQAAAERAAVAQRIGGSGGPAAGVLRPSPNPEVEAGRRAALTTAGIAPVVDFDSGRVTSRVREMEAQRVAEAERLEAQRRAILEAPNTLAEPMAPGEAGAASARMQAASDRREAMRAPALERLAEQERQREERAVLERRLANSETRAGIAGNRAAGRAAGYAADQAGAAVGLTESEAALNRANGEAALGGARAARIAAEAEMRRAEAEARRAEAEAARTAAGGSPMDRLIEDRAAERITEDPGLLDEATNAMFGLPTRADTEANLASTATQRAVGAMSTLGDIVGVMGGLNWSSDDRAMAAMDELDGALAQIETIRDPRVRREAVAQVRAQLPRIMRNQVVGGAWIGPTPFGVAQTVLNRVTGGAVPQTKAERASARMNGVMARLDELDR